MAITSGFFKKLKERLWGKVHEIKVPVSPAVESQKEAERPPCVSTDDKRPRIKERDSYFIQIGFDFGTSYSKCICRDVIKDKAWVHLPPGFEDQETPFLIPSTFLLMDGKFKNLQNSSIEYHRNGLNHIKLALEKVALHKLNDAVLKPYIEAIGDNSTKRLSNFVQACGVYLLAGALGNVRKDIRKRFPDFGLQSKDYMAVNLAIPVADAEQPGVNALFQKVLFNAWSLSDKIAGYPKIGYAEVEKLISQVETDLNPDLNEACYLYPEVSANVQGFVRSRVSKEGIYLFSDTGAGSVDQSVFIYFKNDSGEQLTYLHGSVLPLGSSRIEHMAASSSGNLDWQNLETWRKKKETGGKERELIDARNKIEEELCRKSHATLAWANKKLYRKKQLHDIRLIYGGGGHCERPYATGVKQSFSSSIPGSIFPRGISPNTVGMPIPRDLELAEHEKRWMNRLSVAYGLSFVRANLVNFIYPKDLEDPNPDKILSRPREIPDPPTKDQC